MSQALMKSPHELKAFLAERTVLDPMKELEVLVDLLESSELTHMPERHKVEMLEILWPSLRALLILFERQMNGAWQKQHYAENASFLGFERLAKLAQQAYSAAALALHNQSKPWWGVNPREIALSRAIDLSAQIALARLSLHIPFAEGYWHNFYSLWREAEHADLLATPVKDSNLCPPHAKLAQVFLGLATLATLPTNALPTQEIPPLLACFIHFSSLDQVLPEKPAENTEWIGVNFEHDLPPYRFSRKNDDGDRVQVHASHYITLTALTQLMQQILDDYSGDFIYINNCAVLISRATLERVVSHLQQPVKPRHERPKTSGLCRLYSGISVIHRLLQEGIRLGQFRGMPLQEDIRLQHPGIDIPPDATNLIPNKSADAHADELWELVSRGHLLYEVPKHAEEPFSSSANEASTLAGHGCKLWNIRDISIDGIHLDAKRLKDDPVLSIGGLVLIEFPKDVSIDYIVGILRWEMSPNADSQEIGIETLAHEARPIRVSGSHQNTSEWYDGLLLSPSKQYSKPMLVLPNQEYRIGASIMASLPLGASNQEAMEQNESMQEYILAHKILQTASICVFQFKDLRESTGLDLNPKDNQDVAS